MDNQNMTQFSSSETKTTHKEPDEKFCADCGQAIKKAAEICPHCGVRQMATPFNLSPVFHATTPNGKNKNVAALLAFFLGGLGVHQFYLGRMGKGFLYLLFCWTAIPSILAIIDLILLLTMDNATFNQKYGSMH